VEPAVKAIFRRFFHERDRKKMQKRKSREKKAATKAPSSNEELGCRSGGESGVLESLGKRVHLRSAEGRGLLR